MRLRTLIGSSVLAATIGLMAPMQAFADEVPKYTEHYAGSSTISVNDILSANAYADGSFGFTQAGASITPVEYSFTDPFLKASNLFTARTFFFGLSDNTIISNAARAQVVAPQQHLVVAMELANSQGAIAQDFSSVFSGSFTESDIISALTTLYDGSSSKDQLTAASSTIFGFIISASSEGALFGASGSNTAFNLVSFSSGTVVGDGKAFITGGDVSGAPEPAEWGLMFSGVALLGLFLRTAQRRSRAARAAA